MTKEQILEKCIEKAVKNGYEKFKWLLRLNKTKIRDEYIVLITEEKIHINEILFDHSFAKAFWGEGEFSNGRFIRGWQYYIMELAKSTDRLEYMKQFIEGGKDESN